MEKSVSKETTVTTRLTESEIEDIILEHLGAVASDKKSVTFNWDENYQGGIRGCWVVEKSKEEEC